MTCSAIHTVLDGFYYYAWSIARGGPVALSCRPKHLQILDIQSLYTGGF